MAGVLERYEREISRINKKDWVTYQWEELILDPIRKRILQKNSLSIPNFRNEEGVRVGRNLKYRDGRHKAWTGFRERLKPFYIYKNKLMIYWVPNMRTKTQGKWEVGVYMEPNFANKTTARVDRAIALNLMPEELGDTIKKNARDYQYNGGPNQLGWPNMGDSTKVVEGGSVQTVLRGNVTLQRTHWNDDGELQNLKSAKTFVENIWKMGAVNEDYLAWMDDDTIISSVPVATPWRNQELDGDIGDKSSWYNYIPFDKLSDWSDIITRPLTSYIINWTNFAPSV